MVIELKAIEKGFVGVKSLDRVSFSVAAGEVHALVGENGAGKSTLMKVLTGNYQPDAGEISFEGQRRVWANPAEAMAAGVHIIHQELMLFPERSVAENIFVTTPPRGALGLLDRGAMVAKAQHLLHRLGSQIDPRAKVKTLSLADQQMVEIAKALCARLKVLVLDEPTAVLSGREAELLFARVEQLRQEGVAIVYISHRLDEVFRLADRITVLKDGRYVTTKARGEIDREGLIACMVGRPLHDIYPPRPCLQLPCLQPPQPARLTVRNLRSGPRLRDVSFELHRGEILGLGGMVGAGRSEVAHAIFGSAPADAGEVLLDGLPFTHRSPRRAIDRGIGFVTEDRKGEGLMLLLDCASNISAPILSRLTRKGLIDRAAETELARADISQFGIAITGPRARVHNLSGGNQQKVLLARWARACKNVLILDEPTRGVDIGAKVEIYRFIRALAAQGVAVLLISSELNELIGLCDRVLVLREGVATGCLSQAEITEDAILSLATHPTQKGEVACVHSG